eukprot:scaffold26965_cov50-Phaeocystis_antarctica.AAC.1
MAHAGRVCGVGGLGDVFLLHPVELGALRQRGRRRAALGCLLGLLARRLGLGYLVALGLAARRHPDGREEEEALEAEGGAVRLVVRVLHGPRDVLQQQVRLRLGVRAGAGARARARVR